MSQPTNKRPRVVTRITIASGVIALLCVVVGLFLLYSALVAPDPAAANNVKLLSLVVIAMGLAYAVLTIGFYALRPWSYGVMRGMVRGTLSPLFARWGWYEAIDSAEVQRAFGLKVTRKRERG